MRTNPSSAPVTAPETAQTPSAAAPGVEGQREETREQEAKLLRAEKNKKEEFTKTFGAKPTK